MSARQERHSAKHAPAAASPCAAQRCGRQDRCHFPISLFFASFRSHSRPLSSTATSWATRSTLAAFVFPRSFHGDLSCASSLHGDLSLPHRHHAQAHWLLWDGLQVEARRCTPLHSFARGRAHLQELLFANGKPHPTERSLDLQGAQSAHQEVVQRRTRACAPAAAHAAAVEGIHVLRDGRSTL
jgi:hypothetical protein